MKRFDAYDGMCFFGGLVFFAPVALLVRTQAGISESLFFLLQALLSVTMFVSEVPTGIIGDRIGYKNSLVLSQVTILAARVLLLLAFLLKSPGLFVIEAVVEGFSYTFSSGTAESYVYEVYGKERYLSKTAQVNFYGTAGFILSTLSYGLLYPFLGIPGLLAATAGSCAISFGFALALPKEKAGSSEDRPASPSFSQLLSILKEKQALVLMALASLFSVAGILVNFFFAEKLVTCGVDVGWMSPIILVYSLIQMLCKPILDRLGRFPGGKVLGLTCGLGAVVLMIFGVVNHAGAVIPMMLLLPLLLSLPGFFLSQQENAFIDRYSGGKNRAATLSVLSMGVNLVEILALFASSLLAGASVGICFLAVGGLLLMFGIGYLCK